MSSSLSSLVQDPRLAGVEAVECVTPDLNGIPRGKIMTPKGFLEGRRLQMARGVLFQCVMGGYPPPRYYGGDDGDLVLAPDLGQLHRLPWSEQPRALVICDAQEADGVPCLLSTRSLLRRVLQEYAGEGLRPVVASELEFFLFEPNPDPLRPFEPPRGLDGRTSDAAGAFSVSANQGHQAYFDEVYAAMRAFGLPRDTFLHEMGASQFEINLLHGDALQAADQTFLFKHLLREIALRHGLIAVCMAKPLAGTPGSSMHLHQSLVRLDDGSNVFSDGEGGETPVFRHFIGGLQAALGDLTLLFAPYVNSYQRLFHPFASPNNACWGYDNRAAGRRRQSLSGDCRQPGGGPAGHAPATGADRPGSGGVRGATGDAAAIHAVGGPGAPAAERAGPGAVRGGVHRWVCGHQADGAGQLLRRDHAVGAAPSGALGIGLG